MALNKKSKKQILHYIRHDLGMENIQESPHLLETVMNILAEKDISQASKNRLVDFFHLNKNKEIDNKKLEGLINLAK